MLLEQTDSIVTMIFLCGDTSLISARRFDGLKFCKTVTAPFPGMAKYANCIILNVYCQNISNFYF